MGKTISPITKVVLGTNVFVSAFLWQKQTKEIFNLAEQNKIQICVTQEILDEYEKILNYPKFSSKLKSVGKNPSEIINELLEIAKLYSSLQSKKSIIRQDPTDDKFLLCALSAGASVIISGDNHLLNLKNFQRIPILTPAQSIKKLQESLK